MLSCRKSVWMRSLTLLGLVMLLLVAVEGVWAAPYLQSSLTDSPAVFPFLSPDIMQRNLLLNAFAFQMRMFGALGGEGGGAGDGLVALKFFALTGAMVGALMTAFNPKYRQPSVFLPWLLLIVITIFMPYGSQLLFYPASKEALGNGITGIGTAAISDCEGANAARCGFTPQLAALHVASLFELTFSEIFRSLGWNSLMKLVEADKALGNSPDLVMDPDYKNLIVPEYVRKCGNVDWNRLAGIYAGRITPMAGEGVITQPKTVRDGMVDFDNFFTGEMIRSNPPRALVLFDDAEFKTHKDKNKWVDDVDRAYEAGLTEIYRAFAPEEFKGLNVELGCNKTTCVTAAKAIEVLDTGGFFKTTDGGYQLYPGYFFTATKASNASGTADEDNSIAGVRRCFTGFNNQEGLTNALGASIDNPICFNGSTVATLTAQQKASYDEGIKDKNFLENGAGTPWEKTKMLIERSSDSRFMSMPIGEIRFDQVITKPGQNPEAPKALAPTTNFDCIARGKEIITGLIDTSIGPNGLAKHYDKLATTLKTTPSTVPKSFEWESITSVPVEDPLADNTVPPDFPKNVEYMINAFNGALSGLADNDKARHEAILSYFLDKVKESTAKKTQSEINGGKDTDANEAATKAKYKPLVVGSDFITSVGGNVAIVLAERLAGIAATFIGPLSYAIVYFLALLVDMALLALVVLTPFLFLAALFMPTMAAGVLTIAVMGTFILKFVPVTLLIMNNIGMMIYNFIGMSGHDHSNVMQSLMIIAMAGLYANVIGMTFFLLFKLGDPATVLSKFTALDASAKQIADKGWDYTKALGALAATTIAAVGTGGIAAGLGQQALKRAGRRALTAAGVDPYMLSAAEEIGGAVADRVTGAGEAAGEVETEEAKAARLAKEAEKARLAEEAEKAKDAAKIKADEERYAKRPTEAEAKAAADGMDKPLAVEDTGPLLKPLNLTDQMMADAEKNGLNLEALARDGRVVDDKGRTWGLERGADGNDTLIPPRLDNGDFGRSQLAQSIPGTSMTRGAPLIGQATAEAGAVATAEASVNAEIEGAEAGAITATGGTAGEIAGGSGVVDEMAANRAAQNQRIAAQQAEQQAGQAARQAQAGGATGATAQQGAQQQQQQQSNASGAGTGGQIPGDGITVTVANAQEIGAAAASGVAAGGSVQDRVEAQNNDKVASKISSAQDEITDMLESGRITSPNDKEALKKIQKDLVGAGGDADIKRMMVSAGDIAKSNDTTRTQIQQDKLALNNLNSHVARELAEKKPMFDAAEARKKAVDEAIKNGGNAKLEAKDVEALAYRDRLNKLDTAGVVQGEMARERGTLEKMKQAMDVRGRADQMPGFWKSVGSGVLGGFGGIGGGLARIPIIGGAVSEALNEYHQAPERARAWQSVGGWSKFRELKGDAKRMGFFQKELAPITAGTQYQSMMALGAFQGQTDLARQTASEAVAKSRSQYEAMVSSRKDIIKAEITKQFTDASGKLTIDAQQLETKLNERIFQPKIDAVTGKAVVDAVTGKAELSTNLKADFRNYMTSGELYGIGRFEAADRINSVKIDAFKAQGMSGKALVVKGGLTGDYMLKDDGTGRKQVETESVNFMLTPDMLNKTRGDLTAKKQAGEIDDMMITHYGLVEKQYLRGNVEWNKTRNMTSTREGATAFMRQDVDTDYTIGGHLKMVQGKRDYNERKGQYESLVDMRNTDNQRKDDFIYQQIGEAGSYQAALDRAGFKKNADAVMRMTSSQRKVAETAALDSWANKELLKTGKMRLEGIFEEARATGRQKFKMASLKAQWSDKDEDGKIYGAIEDATGSIVGDWKHLGAAKDAASVRFNNLSRPRQNMQKALFSKLMEASDGDRENAKLFYQLFEKTVANVEGAVMVNEINNREFGARSAIAIHDTQFKVFKNALNQAGFGGVADKLDKSLKTNKDNNSREITSVEITAEGGTRIDAEQMLTNKGIEEKLLERAQQAEAARLAQEQKDKEAKEAKDRADKDAQEIRKAEIDSEKQRKARDARTETAERAKANKPIRKL